MFAKLLGLRDGRRDGRGDVGGDVGQQSLRFTPAPNTVLTALSPFVTPFARAMEISQRQRPLDRVRASVHRHEDEGLLPRVLH
ncbi:hypothetical protein ASC65_08880 [Brevundimonas sp. Root1279]|nr:hypothetical protein ASC65_08880 [Brevundimonas sp. Root1279]